MGNVIYKGEKIAIEIIDNAIIGYELTKSGEPIFESIFIIDDSKDINKLFLSAEAIKAKNGYRYFKVSAGDILLKLNTGITCDSCGFCEKANIEKKLNLIPVLDSIYCDKCFTRWENTTRRDNNKKEFEKSRIEYYKKLLDE